MLNWLKRLFGSVKRIEVPGFAIEVHDRKDSEGAARNARALLASPRGREHGVIRGAGNSLVKLNRQPSTSNDDWALLKELRFFLVEAGRGRTRSVTKMPNSSVSLTPRSRVGSRGEGNGRERCRDSQHSGRRYCTHQCCLRHNNDTSIV